MGDHVNKARAGPLRVSAPADIILSENKGAAKVGDGTPWFLNISTPQIFGFFWKVAQALACAGVLVHLGITHYQSVSI
jgi:hypothetical protein